MSKWQRMSKRDKPLPNKSEVFVLCRSDKWGDCAYYKKEGMKCKFYDWYGPNAECVSLVARTNAMVLELQRMGFTVELKKKEGQP